jgi:1,4-dihydroxy-6-naphthoate synthase
LITRRAGPAPDFAREAPRILIPGRYTTANLLTRLYLKSLGVNPDAVELVPARYDRIIPELLAGAAEFGVIIHEERFTYQARGLYAVTDLGDWWEQTTGAPIPLGCIAIRKDAPEDVRAAVTPAIQASVAAAWAAPEDPGLRAFVKEYSQELADDVIQAHIDLYVNDFTRDIGASGRTAFEELFARAGAEMTQQ